ncbi:prolyl oligopeptidase family serine peptidase [Kitasatospora sp. NPDC006697]|uniref:S9 family peptidase n=1 Tax=Kitasatospora sp. NPDC006697 TaxID=3364020 RepID=UPI0036816751
MRSSSYSIFVPKRKKASYDELIAAGGALWWLQSDPDLAGARRLMCATPGAEARPQTPPEVSVGGWLHAYGGGSYAVGRTCQWIIGADDSKVHQLGPDSSLRCAVPSNDDYLYGDLHLADDTLLAVRGTDEGDEIVEIAGEGVSVRVLVRSPGFLAAPRLRGSTIAYLEWNGDQMPWDASRLYVTEYVAAGGLGAGKLVAGGDHESVVQPTWGPDGSLYFLSDRTGWWNLYRWNGSIHEVVPLEADCAPAPWEAGYQSYTFLPDGRIALTVHDGFRTRLVTVDSSGSQMEVDSGLTSIKPYIAACGDQVAVIGSTPFSTPSVCLVDAALPATASSRPTQTSHNLSLSSPTLRETKSGGVAVRYLLHLPTAGDSQSPAPLLVRAHPGPTDDVSLRLDWTVQFFTSRGFAVAEVAYRGSTGQGRVFRQALHGHWGEYDVEDCEAVAKQLLADRLALPEAVFISGASAGGYTALQAASRPGPFTAATATSAIIDPARWAATAPRFQQPHAAILAGPAGAVRAEAIARPVLLVHGNADDIAPVADAQLLAEGLSALKLDHEALILEGVGHYLSAPANLQTALEAELRFYQRLMPETL